MFQTNLGHLQAHNKLWKTTCGRQYICNCLAIHPKNYDCL